MIIKSFKAQNFRNIKSCSVEFEKGVNILLGENAQGKTNAVEGIYFFARGKSFRRGDERDLIKFGEKGFSISIEYEDKDGDNSLEYAIYEREKRRKKNGYKISRASEMIGSFRAVLFSPDDLNLVKGGPEERRDFLNVAISQCFPSYISLYSDYKKALENRNSILKNASKGLYFDENELSAWSELIAEYASKIYGERKKYIEKLRIFANSFMKEISDGKENLDITYKSDIEEKDFSDKDDIKNEYVRIFKENIKREIAAGTTLFGPHREDMLIRINGNDSRIYSSQGQQRSIVLSLKMAEGEVSREIYSEYPVFLFDDVLSELDDRRQGFVLSGMKDRQIIITSCEKIHISGTVTEVKEGIFERCICT
jgi:DNA replication and repair protein RecF